MFAAMDTTSSALARILHLLSIHQDVQSKLRAELREAYENFGDEPDYDQLVNLPYLDAVCRETLRLYVGITEKTSCTTHPPRSDSRPRALSFESTLGNLPRSNSCANIVYLGRRLTRPFLSLHLSRGRTTRRCLRCCSPEAQLS